MTSASSPGDLRRIPPGNLSWELTSPSLLHWGSFEGWPLSSPVFPGNETSIPCSVKFKRKAFRRFLKRDETSIWKKAEWKDSKIYNSLPFSAAWLPPPYMYWLWISPWSVSRWWNSHEMSYRHIHPQNSPNSSALGKSWGMEDLKTKVCLQIHSHHQLHYYCIFPDFLFVVAFRIIPR